jgi:hypothetical protein
MGFHFWRNGCFKLVPWGVKIVFAQEIVARMTPRMVSRCEASEEQHCDTNCTSIRNSDELKHAFQPQDESRILLHDLNDYNKCSSLDDYAKLESSFQLIGIGNNKSRYTDVWFLIEYFDSIEFQDHLFSSITSLDKFRNRQLQEDAF